MIGEMPIICADHRDPALSEAVRRAAILVIGEMLIATPPWEWAETLRDQCWSSELIIIVDAMPHGQLPRGMCEDDGIAIVGRDRAVWAVPDLIRQWQAKPVDFLNRRE